MDKSPKMPVPFREWIRPLRRNWGLGFVAFFMVVCTVVYLTWTSEKIYEASATLFVRENSDLPGQLFEIPGALMQKYLVKNQVAILESRACAIETVKRLQQSDYADSLGILGNSKEKTKLLQRIMDHFKGRTTKTISQKKTTFFQMLKNFQSSIKVSYGRDTDIIILKGQATTTWEASVIVNTWIEAYQNLDRSTNKSEVTQTRAFLESKLREMEKKLSSSEKALTDYQKQNKVVALTAETQQLVTQLASFETLFNQARTEMEALDKEKQYLKSQLDESKKSLIEDVVKVSNQVIQELQKQMAQMVADKAAYEAQLIGAGYAVDQDIKFIQMENRLNGIKEKIVEETKKLVQKDLSNLNPLDRSENLITQILRVETTQKSIGAKVDVLKSIVDDYSKKMSALPDKSLQLARLDRDVQVNNKIYVMLREKYEETRIREAGQTGLINVIDRADFSPKLIKPQKFLNLFLGCFLGLLLGIGLAYGKEYFEVTIKNEKDLKAMGLKVLGSIPVINVKKRKPRTIDSVAQRANEIYPYLLTNQNLSSLMMEYFRTIRTSIYITGKPAQWRTILITSPWPSEGKSTTAANLSIAMAKKGLLTLLIDSDLHKPVQDILFTGAHRKTGLTGILGKKTTWQDEIRETSIENLNLLTSGYISKNAAELLSSAAMLNLIRNIRKQYKIIIFDSPPLLPITDALVLAPVVDGVILVVRSDKTTREDVERSVELLKSVKASIIGTVLTGLSESDVYGYRNYYSYTGQENPF